MWQGRRGDVTKKKNFLSILKWAPRWNKQTIAKDDFEISAQYAYLKKLGAIKASWGGGDVTKKYFFISSTIKYWEYTFFDFHPTSSTCNILFNPRNTNLWKYSFQVWF